jgi:ribosomal protein S18 acetylase RimI-like enzyme
MVSPEAKRQGIGRQMAEFSIDEARRLGFTAMQFDFVVKSNTGAVKLWREMGFEIIGEIPDAFDHAVHGMTNAYIMYRKL